MRISKPNFPISGSTVEPAYNDPSICRFFLGPLKSCYMEVRLYFKLVIFISKDCKAIYMNKEKKNQEPTYRF